MGERRSIAKVSGRTSYSPVGDAQNLRASDLGKVKANPIGVDRLIDAKWMYDKDNADSPLSRQKWAKCGKNQS